VIQHQPIVKGRLGRIARRIRKPLQHQAPRRLARTQPRIQIPTEDAVALLREVAQQLGRLLAARGVAEQRAPPRDAVLHVHVDDEERGGVEPDGRGDRAPGLAFARERHDARVQERACRDDRVAAHPARVVAHGREDKREPVGRRRLTRAVLRRLALDILLQQEDVIGGHPARQDTGRQVVSQPREIAAAGVHVPRRDRERWSRRRSGQTNRRPAAGAGKRERRNRGEDGGG